MFRKGLSLFGALLLTAAGASPTWAQPAATACPPGQSPQFVSGFGALKLRLGARMGDPMDCQHVDPSSGDMVQHTTTGLAYDPNGTGGAAAFTNGWEHYALMDDQVVLWRNASANPPRATPDQAAYVQQTLPLRSRLESAQQAVGRILQQARAGALDDMNQHLGSTIEDLGLDRQALSDTPTPAEHGAVRPALGAGAARRPVRGDRAGPGESDPGP